MSTLEQLDAQRVQQIVSLLPEKPRGLGEPLTDRTHWAGRPIPEIAEQYRTTPLPEQPDELYREFTLNGNRTRWQDVAFHRRGRLAPLVWAECVENKGRYLPAIEALIRALCAERTWVMPAHDAKLTNFHGESVDIDLASSALGWNLATTEWLLGEALSASVRQLLQERVAHFILEPYHDMICGRRPPNHWLTVKNNWNAVCLAGVTGTGLALIESRSERAEYIAAAQQYSQYFLDSFTPDGYCSEGLGYWNYGFGHFVLLSETVRQATGGALNLLSQPKANAPALFGLRILADDNACPAFADCQVSVRPAANTMFYLNRTLQLGDPQWDQPNTPGSDSNMFLGRHLFEWVLYGFPNAATEQTPAATRGSERELRTFFSDAGVLIVRTESMALGKLTAAMKGGHNAEHHNHNDVGSYTVFLNGRTPLLDPGAEEYTARTFSNRRYESMLLSSFGHPVPVAAGQLQQTGPQARASVLAADFTPQQDTLWLDIKAAYPVPELDTLERTFIYDRSGRCSLTVQDTVRYITPQTFETALIARCDWQKMDDARLIAADEGQAVEVEIAVEGGPWELDATQIEEDAQVQPVRLAVRLCKPVIAATVTITIKPLDMTGKR